MTQQPPIAEGLGDMTQTLESLALRCEQAMGPDLGLDHEIGRELHGPAYAYQPYTYSVDAALTLVPEGWRFIADSDGCHCRMTKSSREGRDVTGFAGTLALAISAAALRAQGPSHD